MKYLKDIFYTTTILGLIGFIFFQEKEDKKQWENITPAINAAGFVIEPPNKLDFCKEVVPLQDPFIFKRFDREMYVNVFWHSSTYMIMKRAHQWFPVIEPILKKNNIPDDFKYLACIESSLSNQVSYAGATGFWQFLKATGKEFGLTINEEVDERYYVEASTQAACDYLNKAYKKFNNWTLVAASYNRGIRGIENALTDQQVTSYYDLLLNEETSRYVFRILAMKTILSNPQKYKLKLPTKALYERQKLRRVVVKKTIVDLVDFAKKNETTYKELKELNPWIRSKKKLTIKKGKEFAILIPKH